MIFPRKSNAMQFMQLKWFESHSKSSRQESNYFVVAYGTCFSVFVCGLKESLSKMSWNFKFWFFALYLKESKLYKIFDVSEEGKCEFYVKKPSKVLDKREMRFKN